MPGCERYRHTDPLVVGLSRRTIAEKLGHPDTSAGIPEARWMRAMTFERLVRHERFVSQLLTTAVGALGLARPSAVRRVDAKVSTDRTATLLDRAHLKATIGLLGDITRGGVEGTTSKEDSSVLPDAFIEHPPKCSVIW